LLLVSPAFLATDYVANHELPKFVADDPFQPAARKRVAPVALKPILFDGKMDLRGLEQRQNSGIENVGRTSNARVTIKKTSS